MWGTGNLLREVAHGDGQSSRCACHGKSVRFCAVGANRGRERATNQKLPLACGQPPWWKRAERGQRSWGIVCVMGMNPWYVGVPTSPSEQTSLQPRDCRRAGEPTEVGEEVKEGAGRAGGLQRAPVVHAPCLDAVPMVPSMPGPFARGPLGLGCRESWKEEWRAGDGQV